MSRLVVLVVALAQLALSKTVNYKWDISWVTAAPDGFSRPVIGINGQWPCPQIDVETGDRLVVEVYNGLGNQSTGLHWHGMYQNGTGYMDGTTGVTQCPIPPGHTLTYDFVIDQVGSYWYHSHNLGQYPDGLWGPLIVHDPKFPYANEVDGEFTITLTDWYHQQIPDLLAVYESTKNEAGNSGDEPTPDSALVNGAINTIFKVEPGKTYLIHIICVGNFPGHAFLFDDHNMTVVEVDGVYTQKVDVGNQNVRIATGQRMSVLLKTKNDASKNYAFWDTMDINMLFFDEGRDPPANFNPNVTAWLVYNESAPLPEPPTIYGFDFVDDVSFVPYDLAPVLEPVDHQIIMDVNAGSINGIQRLTINGGTYLQQKVPSLYTALSVGDKYSSNPLVYGSVNPFVLKHNEVVEIVVNDYHKNLHPFHLHGHKFQVLERTAPNAGYFDGTYGNFSKTPIMRDTIMVQNGGYMVMRFPPRVWLFHCHIEWHVNSGLMATMIEAPSQLGNMQVPQDALANCKSYPLPSSGNAAGNLRSPLNLTGAVTTVPQMMYGATYPPGAPPPGFNFSAVQYGYPDYNTSIGL
ncbi:hypothetical protein MMC15_005967 [Xylographa vitiligo]|nr:hypothetical protein [Xylographa vitiligo]